MDDSKLLDLFWERDENALSEVDAKYGSYCRKIAMNILSIHEDAEECVSDTWLRAWESIPPDRPGNLKAWLGRVVRNTALNMWQRNHAQKRHGGMELMLDELAEIIPSAESTENTIDAHDLGRIISGWLRKLTPEDRNLLSADIGTETALRSYLLYLEKARVILLKRCTGCAKN